MNIEQERALLPCPFCGGKPSITKQMGESLWSHDIVLWTGVQCDECEAQVGPTCEGFKVEAVDIWNRRASLQSQDREDAERYRFIRSQENPLERIDYGRGVNNETSCYHMVGGVRELKSGAELDTAIDHARRVEEDGND